MRPPPRARPDRDVLVALPLHVVVRDYPELLAELRARGVDPAASGGRSLARLLGEREDGETILAALLAAVRWRPGS